MKKRTIVLAAAAAVLVMTAGCGQEVPERSWDVVLPSCGEEHATVSGSNTVPHETMGYCGNTQTTVTYPYAGQEKWSASFMFGPSVELTDLLRWLDYDQPVCRCLPEYRVDTEFGTNYGINLSQAYVRYENGQAALTREQVERLRILLDPDVLSGKE